MNTWVNTFNLTRWPPVHRWRGDLETWVWITSKSSAADSMPAVCNAPCVMQQHWEPQKKKQSERLTGQTLFITPIWANVLLQHFVFYSEKIGLKSTSNVLRGVKMHFNSHTKYKCGRLDFSGRLLEGPRPRGPLRSHHILTCVPKIMNVHLPPAPSGREEERTNPCVRSQVKYDAASAVITPSLLHHYSIITPSLSTGPTQQEQDMKL